MFLNIKVFGLTCGILWGLGVFVFTWVIILREGVTGERTIIGRVYRGYTITPLGSLIGFVWAFFDGLIGGVVLGWIYNYVASFFVK